ncbi:MAG: serine--tRNA ligase [Deltaproteobacteria bacterium]|nr:serine--tRNA ligase [Deltaproteobacteria bacterium]
MLDPRFVRENQQVVETALKNRGQERDLSGFVALESEKRALQTSLDGLRHERNTVSQQIGKLKKEKKDTTDIQRKMREVGDRIKDLEQTIAEKDEALKALLMEIPNVPHASVPIGADENDNQVCRTVGEPPSFDFEPKNHWDVGEALGILDFERAAKITGARFPLYMGDGARLERALIWFMLELHTTRHGYKEVLPPFMVNSASMTATGQLPKFEEDLFKISGWDYWLVPTAEVPVTNIHAGEIIDEDALPIYYAAYTPCFRSEAGSYGKDTRGLIRQHQFNKVELVKFVAPETSYDELEKLLENAETVLKELGLHYRVVTLCTGDLGFSSAKTYDIEVWMPGQQKYREISSCSNFEDFQARRGNIRARQKGKKGTRLVHTLNGSGLAVGRTLAAILENFQQADGSVAVPEVLRPYMQGKEAITP